ncbi:MAG: hypothetical protein Q9185_003987 [Variospora sp. 1 TL-2023]
MGWFSGWFGDNNSPQNANDDDPLRNLDPSLREFLDKESPAKYEASTPSPPPPQSQHRPSTQAKPTPQQPSSTSTAEEEKSDTSTPRPSVPSESLFPDGRYAHLWKTYRPRAEVENALKSDQEKLMDLLEGYQSRKARIGKAAMENCALEQEAMSDCYRHGGWKQTMTMCRKENKAFERCYTMQARFLKALGYLSAEDRPADVDEQIQMHADTLYHRMLAQEAAAASAKANNLPAPTFEPLISPISSSAPADPTTPEPKPQPQQQQQQPPSTTSESTNQPNSTSIRQPEPSSLSASKQLYLSKLKPRVRDGLEAEWAAQKLSEEEKVLAARAYAMEAEAGVGVANQVGEMMQETQRRREERRQEGKGTLGDVVSGWLGR